MKNYLKKIGRSKELQGQPQLPLRDVPKATRRQRNRRAKNKRIELYFSPEEYALVQKNAEQHSMKVSPFCKSATLAYFQKLFILPDLDILHHLEVGIRRIGNNANQIAFVANSNRDVNQDQLQQLIRLIKELEALVTQSLTIPDDLESLVRKAIKERPAFVTTLQFILENHDHQSKNP